MPYLFGRAVRCLAFGGVGLASLLCACDVEDDQLGIRVSWALTWQEGDVATCTEVNATDVRLALRRPDGAVSSMVRPCAQQPIVFYETADGRYALDVELMNTARGIVARAARTDIEVVGGKARLDVSVVAKRRSLVFDWKIVADGNIELTCEGAGAKSVRLQAERAGASEFDGAFDCSERSGISASLTLGTYNVKVTLLSSDGAGLSMVTFPIEVTAEAPTDVGAILFRVSDR